jgi:hypothetical protein
VRETTYVMSPRSTCDFVSCARYGSTRSVYLFAILY